MLNTGKQHSLFCVIDLLSKFHLECHSHARERACLAIKTDSFYRKSASEALILLSNLKFQRFFENFNVCPPYSP